MFCAVAVVAVVIVVIVAMASASSSSAGRSAEVSPHGERAEGAMRRNDLDELFGVPFAGTAPRRKPTITTTRPPSPEALFGSVSYEGAVHCHYEGKPCPTGSECRRKGCLTQLRARREARGET